MGVEGWGDVHRGEFKNYEGRNMNPSVSSVVRILVYLHHEDVGVEHVVHVVEAAAALETRDVEPHDGRGHREESRVPDEQTTESHEPQFFFKQLSSRAL